MLDGKNGKFRMKHQSEGDTVPVGCEDEEGNATFARFNSLPLDIPPVSADLF